jgi:hypothetical protein
MYANFSTINSQEISIGSFFENLRILQSFLCISAQMRTARPSIILVAWQPAQIQSGENQVKSGENG